MPRPRISMFRAQGTPAENCSYSYHAGVSGTYSLPSGAYLVSVTAWSAGAGATLQIANGDVIELPSGGSVELTPDGGIVGPCDIVMSDTSQYTIEILI